ncbi:3',5'-cyclic adenosine monophosphate phosphodiesterase CpdA [Sphaerisporangium krabiense]|uniref:3',5'-cyclic AMP phosphodiesterase CpdA n=1 Tax=Sphaerisporangium krabiense TaxID=763782 RepID=A0A7W9DPH5_9ACTN|nr:metallophosphoesterase [Sphaerisporangium krabiense]MBB5626393.1 3',5'-cyclic AMP phosphodiesterase CpdA [Sphaerisporangium krabiense]GII63311.1 3',5'-cyclic adenosine monophosphate phosphodiesterase CpdA [Sphaerisporangium krabiense]
MITLAHVSDVHIDGSPRSVERTERVVRHVSRLAGPIDAVLVTGDIADHGAADEYEIARELLRFPYPSIVCPGNHDSRAEFRKVFLGEASGGAEPVDQVLQVGDVTVALCDSSVPGRNEGRLEDGTLRWLAGVLGAAPGPVLIGMHHQPVPVAIPYVDEIGLLEPERLEELVRAHPRVAGVLVGHAHTAAATTFAGRPVYVAPGVASQALLPQESAAMPPLSFDMPPGFALHMLSGDGRLTTHARVVL